MAEDWDAPAPETEIAAFEQRHGVVLPPEYRNLLLRHDGGDLLRKVRGLGGTVVLLMRLVPLAFAEKKAGTFFNSIQRGLLPIGINGGGDYFLMNLRTGEIKYWDHHADEFDAVADDLLSVAKDIDDLLRRLEPE